MRCFITVVLAGLVGLLATGCDPFETEITLNADGSGKMVQRLKLSPMAYMVIRDAPLDPGAPGRPILTEERAKQWSEAHAAGPVRLASYSSKLDDKGWRAIACEVSFSDLSALAASEWGYPLQLSAAERNGDTELRFSDPARMFLGGYRKRAGSAAGADKEDDAAAMLQTAGAAAAGMRVRLVMNLPMAAIVATGGALSAEGKTFTYDATVKEGVEAYRAWADGKPLVLVLPQNNAVKPFDVKGDFEFRLSNVSVNRSISFENQRQGGEPSRNENMQISFALYGPEGVDLNRANQWRGGPNQTPSEDMLSALKDGEGHDLRGPETNINFSLFGNNFGNNAWKDPNTGKTRYNGNLSISLRPPPGGMKVLALIEGYVMAEQTIETGKLEVKPLKDNLQKDFPLPQGVLRFTSLSPSKLIYTFTPKEAGADFMNNRALRISCLGADGAELQGGGGATSSDGKKVTYTRTFFRQPAPDEAGPAPEVASVVVTYPSRIEKVKLPFKAQDIQLP